MRTWQAIQRTAVSFLLFLLLAATPLPRHWTLIRRQLPGVYYEFSSLNFYVSDGLVLLLLLTAAPRKYSSSPTVSRWWATLLAGLVVWTAVSITWTFDLSITALFSIRLLLLGALALVIMHWQPDRRWLVWGVAGMLVVQTAVALTQFIIQDDLGLRWLGELDLHRYPGGGSILAAGGAYFLRAYGLTPHPNILGGFLASGILTLTAVILTPNQNSACRLLLSALIISAGAALLLTFSRSAWLGMAVGGVYFLVIFLLNGSWRWGKRPLLFLFIGGGMTLAGLAFSQRALLFNRAAPAANTLEARAVNERAALNQLAWELLPLAPLTGVGASVQNVTIIPLAAQLNGVAPQPAHNVPLLLLAELGPVGALLWLALMLLPPVWTAVHLSRRPALLNPSRLWLLGLTAALVAAAVIDLFDYYMWGWPQGRLLRWLLWGMWGAAIYQPSTQNELSDSSLLPQYR
ncbi:MAG: O-antigen ligase family protein [Anaerolineae bacterium]